MGMDSVVGALSLKGRNMKNKILIGVGVLLLIVIVLIWRLLVNLDNIVAGVIEDVGSDMLKTKVSVSGVSIDLKAGKVGIAGMIIANPKGYSPANIFEMEEIEVDLDLKSVNKDVLVIETIRIRNPQIAYEGNTSGGSNMQTLLNNIESAPAEDSAPDDGEGLKMIIDRFEFSGGRVKASSEVKPGESMDIKLPAINISGIGRAQGGVTADVVAKQITSELVSRIISAAAKAGVNRVIEEKKKGLMDKLGEKLKGDG
jgi:uncharacterized protein involved in outer membrane biogenesis